MHFLVLAMPFLSALPLISLGAPTSPKYQESTSPRKVESNKRADHDYSVLILGGGVSGIIAARQLSTAGINDFLIVEARDELGGRMQSTTFGGKGGQKEYVVRLLFNCEQKFEPLLMALP